VQIEDYDRSVGEAPRLFAQLAGNQPNDPVRVAVAIIEAVGPALISACRENARYAAFADVTG
jgi:hypothetical protein